MLDELKFCASPHGCGNEVSLCSWRLFVVRIHGFGCMQALDFSWQHPASLDEPDSLAIRLELYVCSWSVQRPREEGCSPAVGRWLEPSYTLKPSDPMQCVRLLWTVGMVAQYQAPAWYHLPWGCKDRGLMSPRLSGMHFTSLSTLSESFSE